MQKYFPDRALAEKHAQILNADKPYGKNAKLHPDYAVQLKAVELGYKLHGRLKDAQQSQTNVQINNFDPTVGDRISAAIERELDRE